MKDIRITNSTRPDEELTAYLGFDELQVIKADIDGDKRFLVIDKDDSPAECPICHQCGEKFEYYPKEYVDCVVDEHGNCEYIILDHRFVKCICRNDHPKLLKFSKEYSFAYKNAKVTKRMENRVVLMAMRTSCNEAESLVNGMITRQAIGMIVKRWVARCDSLRGVFNTPRDMAVISCTTEDKGYVFFADIGYRKFRIIDVIASIDSDSIAAELKKFEIDKIATVLTDSNSILVDTLRSYLADTTVLSVDTDSLIPPINHNLMEYMKKNARQIDKNVKHYITLSRDALGRNEEGRVDDALASRDELRKIYNHVNLLRKLIKNDKNFDYAEFVKWNNEIPQDDGGILGDTSLYIEHYMDEIINFYRRRTYVTRDVFARMKALVDKISRWSERAPELMRGRILYSGYVDNYEILEEQQWMGVSYEDVMANIEKLIEEGGSQQ